MQVDSDKKLAATDTVHKWNDTVKMKVSYSKDYKGKHHLKEGSTIEVHTLQVPHLEAQGHKVIK